MLCYGCSRELTQIGKRLRGYWICMYRKIVVHEGLALDRAREKDTIKNINK
jgi:hypothetical protein